MIYKTPKTVLVTGSSGLVGSECVLHFDRLGSTVIGIDNNERGRCFGADANTASRLAYLRRHTQNFMHFNYDIRELAWVDHLLPEHKPDLIIHCAAQPSHDYSAEHTYYDWSVNAGGTMNLLTGFKEHCPNSVFIYMSTNKVYGDGPNNIPLIEHEHRFDYANPNFLGINEAFSVDQCMHSPFGVSKLSADLLTQEFGRYFMLKTGVFRGGCLTGSAHAGTKLHGFLSYLVKCAVQDEPYVIYGYMGKQVRDNLHAHDVVRAFHCFYDKPSMGEVFNLGGGRQNSCSIREVITKLTNRLGRRVRWEYVNTPRRGDHVCYITDTTYLTTRFPELSDITPLDAILDEMVTAEQNQ
jgi:CDP-paratose 2-epimerase